MKFASLITTVTISLVMGSVTPMTAQHEERPGQKQEARPAQQGRQGGGQEQARPQQEQHQQQPARQQAQQPQERQQPQRAAQAEQPRPNPVNPQQPGRQNRQGEQAQQEQRQQVQQQARPQQARPQQAQQRQEQSQPQQNRPEQNRMAQQQTRPIQQARTVQQAPQRSEVQARAWQQQKGWAQQGGGSWGHATFAQSRSRNWASDHRTWAQRGGYGGYYIPQDRFSISFGERNSFRLGLSPVMYMGYPRFQYGGFSFLMVDPWPDYWGDNWYDSDDMYIGFDDGYYLYDRRHPGPGLAISIVM